MWNRLYKNPVSPLKIIIVSKPSNHSLVVSLSALFSNIQSWSSKTFSWKTPAGGTDLPVCLLELTIMEETSNCKARNLRGDSIFYERGCLEARRSGPHLILSVTNRVACGHIYKPYPVYKQKMINLPFRAISRFK